MATAPKKSAAAQAVSAAAPVEAVAAAINAVMPTTPQVAVPVEEIQQSFRSALEKSVVESRAAFAKAKTAADEAASAFEVCFAAAKDGALAVNAKTFEALRVNADANFDFLKSVFAAKSLSDVIALQTEFARKQVETMTSQTKDIADAKGDGGRRRADQGTGGEILQDRRLIGILRLWRRAPPSRRQWTPSAVAGGVLLSLTAHGRSQECGLARLPL
jgi:hypothetical protein